MFIFSRTHSTFTLNRNYIYIVHSYCSRRQHNVHLSLLRKKKLVPKLPYAFLIPLSYATFNSFRLKNNRSCFLKTNVLWRKGITFSQWKLYFLSKYTMPAPFLCPSYLMCMCLNMYCVELWACIQKYVILRILI